jgi:hypothetical protein
MGKLNFHRIFLPHAATMQAPLHDSLQPQHHGFSFHHLDANLYRTFDKCKASLSRATLLAYPDSAAPLALVTDSSASAMGAVLQQRVDSAWQLSPAQQKYSAYDRELLAVYEAVMHFRHMLEAHHFTIFTDNKPITFAFQQNRDKCSPRQFSHLDFIAQFTTNIRHTSGQDKSCRRRSLSRRIHHCTKIARRAGRIAEHRRRTSKISGVKRPPSAREALSSRHHRLHLLRHVCRKSSAVRSSLLTLPSVPVYPRCHTQAPQQRRNSSYSVLCGPAYGTIAARAHGLVRPANAPKSLATKLVLWEISRFQSNVLRMIVCAPWYVPNTVIRRGLETPTVKQEILRYSSQYSAFLSAHINDPLVNLMELPDSRRLRRHLPNNLPTRFLV